MPKVVDVPDLSKSAHTKKHSIVPKPIQNTIQGTSNVVAKTMKLMPKLKGRNESPLPQTFDALLNIKIISGTDLEAKNRDGTSDPYVILKIGDSK